MTDDPIEARLAELRRLADRPWGEWQAFVEANREARAQMEESARRCDRGDLHLFAEPLSAPARREIARLDGELLMLAAGLCPITGERLPASGRPPN